jgi:hypothetical protein
VRLWQEIALALLKKYTERYYTFRKREWELPHLEYRDLEADDPNFLGVGSIQRQLLPHPARQVAGRDRHQAGRTQGRDREGRAEGLGVPGLKAIWFGRHLYQPLLYLDSKIVEISPAPLNKGERLFVEDLKAFHDGQPAFFKTRSSTCCAT